MVRRKVGTYTLAAGLISIGALWLAQNFIDFTIKEGLKYWPVLLIGLGIEMIIHMVMQSQENQDSRISVDSIAVVFIIVVAVISSTAGGFNFSFPINLNVDGNTIIDGTRYETQVKESVVKENVSANVGLNTLKIDNYMGDITILPADTNSIRIEAEVTVKCNDKAKASEYAKNAIVIKEGATTELSTKRPSDAHKRDYAAAQIAYTIYVPQSIKVEIDEKFGDVRVEGINGSVVIENKYGKTAVKDVQGTVELNNAFGSIELENIGGRVEAETKNGKITAKDIKSSVKLESSFGSIEASDITGDLNASSKNGRVTASNITGKTELESSFGSLRAEKINGYLYADSKNGSVEAYDVVGDVKLKSSFGSIKLDSEITNNCDLTAKTSFGSINTDKGFNVKKSGSEVTAEGRTGSGQYRVELNTSNGSIEIR